MLIAYMYIYHCSLNSLSPPPFRHSMSISLNPALSLTSTEQKNRSWQLLMWNTNIFTSSPSQKHQGHCMLSKNVGKISFSSWKLKDMGRVNTILGGQTARWAVEMRAVCGGNDTGNPGCGGEWYWKHAWRGDGEAEETYWLGKWCLKKERVTTKFYF